MELADGTVQSTPRADIVMQLEKGSKALHIPTQAVVKIINCKKSHAFDVQLQDAAGSVLKDAPLSALGACVGAKALWFKSPAKQGVTSLARAKVIKVNPCTRKTSWTFDIKLMDGTEIKKVSRFALTMAENARVMYYPKLAALGENAVSGIAATVTGVQYTQEKGYLFDLRLPDDRICKGVSGTVLALTAGSKASGRDLV